MATQSGDLLNFQFSQDLTLAIKTQINETYSTFLTPPVCDLLELPPGQPGGADWMVTNPFTETDYDLRLCVNGYGDIHHSSFSNTKGILKFICTVKAGQYLWFKNNEAYITDRNYRIIEHVKYHGAAILTEGNQNISFACEFSGEEGPEVITKLFVRDKPYIIEPTLAATN